MPTIPQKSRNASRTLSIWPSPPQPTKSYAECPTPLPRETFQFKSTNFTTKIQYDGNFAKNGHFALIFASINIKSHYLQDLNIVDAFFVMQA